MSSLTLTLKPSATGRLDLRGVVPDRLCGVDLASIAAFEVQLDHRPRPLGEVFTIEDGDRDRLIVRGDLSRADFVGGGMTDGLMHVHSDVGHRVADKLRGGMLVIHGSVGDFACSTQRGGMVEITGNAGSYCAGACPNSRRGMRGGVCRVHGSAGKYAGYRLRRGTLILSGAAELGLGSAMIAGTIVCLGTVATPWAVGMRRGTIMLLQRRPTELHVGFTRLEPVQLSYLPILLADLRRYLLPNEAELFNSSLFHRALGDRSVGGMGEILLIPQPADELP